VNHESHLDVFLWHFGQTADQVVGRLNSTRMAIIGVNHISRRLATTLSSYNHNSFDVIDHPEHRNRLFFDQVGQLKKTEWPAWLKRPLEWQDDFRSQLHGCVVTTSECGGQAALFRWNSFCLDNKVLFVPLLLKSMIGHLGPFIVPGETACYQCLVSRQGSHASNSDIDTITDHEDFQSQQVCGFHPSMATILGELAAFEIMRFYSDAIPGRKAGRLLEVDLLASRITERTVLKVPRCTACSPLRRTTPTDLCKALFP
jgi:bacteriocin biosynthesis cyclodehydratase domain-containing protein